MTSQKVHGRKQLLLTFDNRTLAFISRYLKAEPARVCEQILHAKAQCQSQRMIKVRSAMNEIRDVRRVHTTLRYTTLHYTTLHYCTLHYATLHYTRLHYTTLHYTTLHYTNWSVQQIRATLERPTPGGRSNVALICWTIQLQFCLFPATQQRLLPKTVSPK